MGLSFCAYRLKAERTAIVNGMMGVNFIAVDLATEIKNYPQDAAQKLELRMGKRRDPAISTFVIKHCCRNTCDKAEVRISLN